MADAQLQTLEPFVELISRPDGRLARVGYRPAGLDRILASVELPAHVLERAVTSDLEISLRVTPAGEVVSQIFSSSETALSEVRFSATIDHLISHTVSLNNLRLEEASPRELGELLKSLELAVEHVRTALTQTSVWA